MFCFQCQETAKNSGCTIRGVCGKSAEVAQLQDLLIWVLKGLALAIQKSKPENTKKDAAGLFISKALFATITNANFDLPRIEELVTQALKLRNEIYSSKSQEDLECLTWQPKNISEYALKAPDVGVLSNSEEDSRSLKELVVYGLKGIAAYVEHAAMLGKEDPVIWDFFIQTLADLTKPLTVDELVSIVMQTGNTAVTAMALLDKANTEAYGNPEITKVNLGVGSKPGILVSGHDLKDFEELLIQSENQGIDIYTHSEMLPANAYPAFKKYKHFHGNYGSSWWHQDKEFESFHGPILMTTNCIVPVKDSYKARLFTTGMAGYPGCTHIPERSSGGKKDFSALIKLAKTCSSPESLETGTLTVGFAHHQVLALADKVVEAVKSGAIKKFVVMAGCDGRQKDRAYFTDIAQGLPDNTIILTAGCAKYRYNKLSLGDIGGIPRVLDAGQCNDSYSLALIALKLKEVFGLEDVNQLPLAFDIAWYEQKAVAVLLALLSLGFKNIRLGPTLPAFLSPTVVSLLVKNFGIQGITTAEEDLKALTV